MFSVALYIHTVRMHGHVCSMWLLSVVQPIVYIQYRYELLTVCTVHTVPKLIVMTVISMCVLNSTVRRGLLFLLEDRKLVLDGDFDIVFQYCQLLIDIYTD